MIGTYYSEIYCMIIIMVILQQIYSKNLRNVLVLLVSMKLKLNFLL